MKKLTLFLFCMFMTCIQAFAQQFTVGKLKYEVIANASLEVRLCSYQDQTLEGAVTIPTQVTYDNQRYRG